MAVFEGVFAKRGDCEPSQSNPSGVFEDVFVRRGRWRKGATKQDRDDVVDLAENVVADFPTVEYPMPSLTDIANKAPKSPRAEASVIVKNTFVNAELLDFDSLQDFLKERKVKSCPASRQASTEMGSMTMLMSDLARIDNADSGLKDEVLNTASSIGGVLHMSAVCSPLPKEAVFNTASTLMDTRSDLLHRSISEEANECEWQHVVAGAESALAHEQDAPTEERLRSLRLKGSAIQEKINQDTFQEMQPVQSLEAGGSLNQAPSNQFLVAVQTPDGIVPGVVTLLGGAQSQQQAQLPTPCPSEPPTICGNIDPMMSMTAVPPPPAAPAFQLADALADMPSIGSFLSEPPAICGNIGPMMSMPAVPPPPAAPVLRLADAIAAPDIGGPDMPSIGSLLHHKGECKPCTFFHTRGCENGDNCKFCHLCLPGEKKKRLKAMKAAQREANAAAVESAMVTLASLSAAEKLGFHVDTIVE